MGENSIKKNSKEGFWSNGPHGLDIQSNANTQRWSVKRAQTQNLNILLNMKHKELTTAVRVAAKRVAWCCKGKMHIRKKKKSQQNQQKLSPTIENSLLSGSFLNKQVFLSDPDGAVLCFFVWSSCQLFYLCRRKGKRIWLSVTVNQTKF